MDAAAGLGQMRTLASGCTSATIPPRSELLKLINKLGLDIALKAPILLRRVANVQDHVRDRVVVEGPQLRGKFEVPVANCSGTFERKVALIAKVELEDARIVVARAHHY